MPLDDPILLASLLRDTGFFGVTAWLLAERFVMAKRRDKLFGMVVETVNTNASALREHAIATQRLADMVDREAELMTGFRHEVVEAIHTVGRNRP